MTNPHMSKRDELALILCHEENGDEGCGDKCIHPAHGSFCPYGPAVDKILDSLMEVDREICATFRGDLQPIWDNLIAEFITKYLATIRNGGVG